MTILGIIGNGYVGRAVHAFFHEQGYEVRVHDKAPSRCLHTMGEACNTDFVFICVPTPTQNGQQDIQQWPTL